MQKISFLSSNLYYANFFFWSYLIFLVFEFFLCNSFSFGLFYLIFFYAKISHWYFNFHLQTFPLILQFFLATNFPLVPFLCQKFHLVIKHFLPTQIFTNPKLSGHNELNRNQILRTPTSTQKQPNSVGAGSHVE